MSRPGPDVGNLTSLSVYSTSVSPVLSSSTNSALQSSTLLLSSSRSIPTSDSTTPIITSNEPPTTSQSAQTTNSDTSSVGQIDPSSVSPTARSVTNATSTFTAGQNTSTSTSTSTTAVTTPLTASQSRRTTSRSSIHTSHVDPSSTSVSSAQSTTSLSTSEQGPDTYYSLVLSGNPSSTTSLPNTLSSPLASSATSPPYPPAPSPTTSTFFTNGQDHGTSTWTPEPTSTGVPLSTLTSVSNTIEVTTGTERTHTHHFTKRPKAPQQLVSTSSGLLVTIVTQTTEPGTILRTTLTLESVASVGLVPIPTASSVLHNSLPESNSPLSLILGLVLGLLGIVAVVATFFRCRARRRSKYMSQPLSCGASQERKERMMTEETPRTVTRITSYRPSPILNSEHVTSHAGESFQSSDEQLSDPFADSSTIVSSRTSMSAVSIHSADSVSTNIEFAVSENTDTRDGDSARLIDTSTSSLEVHFVAPRVARHDASTRSPYLSPTWHYDGQSPSSSSRNGEYRNKDETSQSPRVSPPVPSKPFFLGTDSARLRLHALLKEARGG